MMIKTKIKENSNKKKQISPNKLGWAYFNQI